MSRSEVVGFFFSHPRPWGHQPSRTTVHGASLSLSPRLIVAEVLRGCSFSEVVSLNSVLCFTHTRVWNFSWKLPIVSTNVVPSYVWKKQTNVETQLRCRGRSLNWTLCQDPHKPRLALFTKPSHLINVSSFEQPEQPSRKEVLLSLITADEILIKLTEELDTQSGSH